MKGYYSDDYRNRTYPCNDYIAEQTENCGCSEAAKEKAHIVAAMVYIDFQPGINSADLYECEKALKRGTMFVGLDKPLELRAKGGGCSCRTANVNY